MTRSSDASPSHGCSLFDVAPDREPLHRRAVEDDQPGGEIDPRAQFFPFSYAPEELPDVARAMERFYSDPAGDLDRSVRQFLYAGGRLQQPSLDDGDLCDQEGFSYERRDATGVQTPLRFLERHGGSCRDFAVLMMEAARSLGFAAFSFLATSTSKRRRRAGPIEWRGDTRLVARSLCAWAGWLDFDPSNGLVGSAELIRVAVACSHAQATPLGVILRFRP